jgi:oxygen-independent coproporphyrinogen-3 oxidase
MKDYLGLGLNSHSFIDNERFSNTSSLKEYKELIKNGKKPLDIIEKEDSSELLKDTIITGLRLSNGININEINKKFNIDFKEKYKSVLDKYINNGFLKIKKENLCFTDKGFSVSNYILSDFI